MRHVSMILLTLPDGRIVLQRRGKGAPRSPGKLGFFGGHVEEGESYDDAMRRELSEETSLKMDDYAWGYITDYQLEPRPKKDPDVFHLYWAEIPNADFEVDKSEADGAEVYARDEAIARDDVADACRYVLENILKEKK
jgi:8-oxo-dGTP pyrophosphatase MutT (NUDIX family)